MKTNFVLILVVVACFCMVLGRTRTRSAWSERFGEHSALDRALERWHPRLGFISLLCVGVASVLAFSIVQDWRTPVALGAYVTVYPNAEAEAWAPGMSRDKVWLFTSPDALRAIHDFYETVALDDEWELEATQAGDVLHLRLDRPSTQVTILAERYVESTEISYRVVSTVR